MAALLGDLDPDMPKVVIGATDISMRQGCAIQLLHQSRKIHVNH